MAEFGFASDETLQKVVDAHAATNTILQVMMADTMATVATDLQAIKHIVQQGSAESIFAIGDQIINDWTENVSGTTYSMPHNVVSFDNVTLQDGESIPGMWLQCHYASAFGIPFDEKEAFYYAADGLSAGVYCFTTGASCGKVPSGETYYFTLTNDVPAGGQLVFASDLNSVSPEGASINVYAFPTVGEDGDTSALTTILETTTMSVENGGNQPWTDLGTIVIKSDEANYPNFNSLQRAIYGSNRWSQSAIRQYLNSSVGIGEWWTPQNNFDRPPSQLTKYPGFMSGYDSAFLSAIQKVKVTTALNTVWDGGGSEDTYDYFFLPSLEQQYITPQVSGVEGDYWPYWKRACGSETTIKTGVTGAFPLTYAINAKTSAQYVRLRSAYRGSAYGTWLVNSSGGVYSSPASAAYRFAPACVIC